MLTCQKLVEFLDDYVAGKLKSLTRARFRLHLTLCGPCRRYLKSYRETIRLGQAAFSDPEAAVPAEVPEELVKAVLAAKGREA